MQRFVAACAQGRSAVCAVSNVDEAIALLTGVEAGEADADGNVPEGTINFRVAFALARFSSLRQAYAAAARPRGGSEGGSDDAVPPAGNGNADPE